MTSKIRHKSRPATRADLKAFFGELPGHTVRARVLEIDGEIVGVAGYWMAGGTAVMFSDKRGDIPAVTIWRESKTFLDNMKVPALCVAESTSGKFLERLGWEFLNASEDGDVYEWQP